MRDCFELTVVAGVSLLLVICLTGALDTAQAKKIFCESNLKRLYTACSEYQNAHGILPPVIHKSKPKWKFWMHFMAPYIKKDSDLACPADSRQKIFFSGSRSPLVPQQPRGVASYGMNFYLTPGFAAKRGKTALLKNLSRPHLTILFGDCKGPYMYPDRYWKQEKSTWHDNQSVNMIHADGHLANYTRNDLCKVSKSGKFIHKFQYWVWN